MDYWANHLEQGVFGATGGGTMIKTLARLGLSDVCLSPWALEVIQRLLVGLDAGDTKSLRQCFYGLVRIRAEGGLS